MQLRFLLALAVLVGTYTALATIFAISWSSIDQLAAVTVLGVAGLAIVPGVLLLFTEGRQQYLANQPVTAIPTPEPEIYIIPIIVEVETPKRPLLDDTTRPLVFMAAGVVIATIISVLLSALFTKKRTSNKS